MSLERLIRSCTDRRELAGGSEDLPILLLWRTRDPDGLELLLDHVSKIENWSGPRASLDGANLANMRPHEIALLLALQFGQHTHHFGRAEFPRFFIGLKAIRMPLDGPAPAAAARLKMIDWLTTSRPGLLAAVQAAVAVLARRAGLGGLADSGGVAPMVEHAFAAIQRMVRRLSPPVRWYRNGLDPWFAAGDPFDALVVLDRQEFAGNHRLVDEVLCRAFVEDLRATFAKQTRLYARATNAVVLLDNAETEAVRVFLELLAAQPGGSGPLLVVAASDRRYPQAAVTQPRMWQPDVLAGASIANWLAGRAQRGGSRFYPVRLGPVVGVSPMSDPDRPEIYAITGDHQLDARFHRTVAFARRLTAAHPTGFPWVLEALRDAGAFPLLGAAPTRVDLRTVLSLSGLDDRILQLVLGRWPKELRRALVLMATAVDLSDSHLAPILGDSGELGELVTRFRDRDLWVTHRIGDGAARPPRLHPLARRAIAHRLAREGGIAGLELCWDQAHELHRGAADAPPATVLYHDLALGRVHEVASSLAEEFDPVDPRPWYELLTEVTAAPLAHPDSDAAANDRLAALCKGTEPDPTVSRRLVAALQLHADPLGDPHHDLCRVIAAELTTLSSHAEAGRPFLLARNAHFKNCWDRWHGEHG